MDLCLEAGRSLKSSLVTCLDLRNLLGKLSPDHDRCNRGIKERRWVRVSAISCLGSVEEIEWSVREVKEVFEFRMAIQPAYGGAWKAIGHTRARRFLIVVFKWGKKKDTVFVVTAYPAKGKHVEVYLRTTGGLR
jgi:hypothetical protein